MADDVSAYPSRRRGVHVRREDIGPMLVVDDDGRTYLLNETALALWELCDGVTAPDEMVDAVRIACGVARDVAELDVSRTLRELTEAGLLSWGGADG
jgi:hypothetical protein